MSDRRFIGKRIKDGEKILIMKPSSLGDIAHTIPVVQAIKRQFPGCYISWFVLSEYQDLVCLLEDVDETIPFYRHGFKVSPLKYLRDQLDTILELRRSKFDWVLDFQGLLRSALFSCLSGCSKRFGFSWKNEPNRLLYNFYTKIDRQEHALERILNMAKILGIDVNKRDLKARFKKLNYDHSVPGGVNKVVFCPGGRWQSKRWPVQNYAALAKYVVEKLGKEVVLIGSREEKDLGEIISNRTEKGVIDLIGRIPLKVVPSVLAKADLVVTNDSGPMHLAAAMGKKVLAFFGPTDPSLTGPYGLDHVVFTADVDCRPCFQRSCNKNLECLRMIPVERVIEELEKLVSAE